MNLIVSTNQKTNGNEGEFYIESSGCGKLLGAKIDNELTFDHHVSDIWENPSRKINSLVRIALYKNIVKRRILMN